jgi:hypothetical protein
MADIYFDLPFMRQQIEELRLNAEAHRQIGEQALRITRRAPGYEGQFGPRVRAEGLEIHARYTRRCLALNEQADRLEKMTNAFEAADRALEQGMAALPHFWERSPWWSAVVTDLSQWSLGQRPPAGIPEDIWDRLPIEDRLAIWAGILGDRESGAEATEGVPASGHPAPDEGAGPFDSVSPSPADYAFQQLLYVGAAQWDLIQDRPDAARHMRHYLEGSGEPLDIDVEQLLQDEPAFQLDNEVALRSFVRDIEAEIQDQYAGEPISFQRTTAWLRAPYSRSDNWYYAMGGYSYAYAAEVSVAPPSTPGGNPTVQVDYQLHVWDYYNWDTGKSVTIPRPTLPMGAEPISLPIPEEYEGHISELGDQWLVQDTALGRLHLTGLAQEYEMRGQTDVATLQFELDSDSALLIPIEPELEPPPPGR